MLTSRLRWLALCAVLPWGFQIGRAEDNPAPASPEVLFKELDKNSDGSLVLDEIPEDRRPFLERLIRIADANEDGKLTPDEFANGFKPEAKPDQPQAGPDERGRRGGPGGRPEVNPDQIFERLDQNKDGKLTKDELKDRPGILRLFERLGKGELTKDDFAKGRERPPEGRADRRPEGRPESPDNPEELFQRMDGDKDGKVDLKEVEGRGRFLLERVLFHAGKTKHDALTKDEFLAGLKEFRNEDRGPEGRGPERRGPEGRRREGDRGPEGRSRDGDGPDDRRRDGDRAEGRRGDGDRGPDDRRRERDRDGDRPERREGRGPDDRRPEGRRSDDGPDGRPHHRPPGGELFRKLDKNDDGRLSKDELMKVSEMFEELDKNKDGELNPHELFGPPPRPDFGNAERGRMRNFDRKHMEASREGQGRGEGKGRRGDKEGRREGRSDEQFGQMIFKKFDANSDGKIAESEAPPRLKNNFKKFDGNGDGSIGRDELMARLKEKGDKNNDGKKKHGKGDDRKKKRDKVRDENKNRGEKGDDAKNDDAKSEDVKSDGKE